MGYGDDGCIRKKLTGKTNLGGGECDEWSDGNMSWITISGITEI
jgi:hypothetical protein